MQRERSLAFPFQKRPVRALQAARFEELEQERTFAKGMIVINFAAVLMISAAVLWGSHGVLVAVAGAPMGTTMLFRTGTAIIAMMTGMLASGRLGQFRPTLSVRSVVSSLAWTANSALFVAAITLGGAVDSVVVLVYSYPVYTVAIRFVQGKAIGRADVSSVCWGLAGVLAIVANGWQAAPVLPLVFALLSGMGLALHLEINEVACSREETEFTLIGAMLIGLLMILGLGGCGVVDVSLPQSRGQLIWLLVLGIVTGLTYALYAYAGHVRNRKGVRLTSVQVGQILLLEIVVAAVLDWILLGSTVSVLKLIGGACILRALWIQIHKK